MTGLLDARHSRWFWTLEQTAPPYTCAKSKNCFHGKQYISNPTVISRWLSRTASVRSSLFREKNCWYLRCIFRSIFGCCFWYVWEYIQTVFFPIFPFQRVAHVSSSKKKVQTSLFGNVELVMVECARRLVRDHDLPRRAVHLRGLLRPPLRISLQSPCRLVTHGDVQLPRLSVRTTVK